MLSQTKNEILIKYTPLVRRIAKALISRLPANVEIDDLIQEGLIAVHDSQNRFDPSIGASFETFVSNRIRGAMLDFLRESDPLGRQTRREVRSIDNAKQTLSNRLGRSPVHSEIAKEIGISLDEYFEIARLHHSSITVNLEEDAESDNEGSLVTENIKDPEDKDPLVLLEKIQFGTLLDEAIQTLNERERLVLTGYAYNDVPIKDLGKKLGVTESRVSQIYSELIEKVRKYLARRGMIPGVHEAINSFDRGVSRENLGHSQSQHLFHTFQKNNLPRVFSIQSVTALDVPSDLSGLLRLKKSGLSLEVRQDSVFPSVRVFPTLNILGMSQLNVPENLIDIIRVKRQSDIGRITDDVRNQVETAEEIEGVILEVTQTSREDSLTVGVLHASVNKPKHIPLKQDPQYVSENLQGEPQLDKRVLRVSDSWDDTMRSLPPTHTRPQNGLEAILLSQGWRHVEEERQRNASKGKSAIIQNQGSIDNSKTNQSKELAKQGLPKPKGPVIDL